MIPDDDEEDAGRSHGSWWKAIAVTALFIVVAVLVVLAVDRVFGHAKIAIDFQKMPWQYQASIVADKAVATPNLAQKACRRRFSRRART